MKTPLKSLPRTSLIMVLILGSLVNIARAETRPDLTGRVLELDGTPLAKATIFVYSARPKQGTSNLCPYCYADCRKQARSDANGEFKIESLDPTLSFRLLVVAAGHESQFVTRVDPTNGAPEVVLKPLTEEALESPLRIKGLVIDEAGQPVPGTVISPEGVGFGSSCRWGGNDDVVEPLAVAGDDGRFVLFCKTNAIDAIYAVAEGRGVAKQWVTFKPGGDYLVRLPAGVTLTGRILRDGQPLADIQVAANTKDRICGNYIDCDPVATDAAGRFQMLNVPPGREFLVCAKMNSLHGLGTLPDKLITTGASATVQDLGELAIQPAYTVSGRIVLSDGQSTPPDTRLFLGRENVADSLETKLEADGRFEFKGVPAGTVSLSLRVPGYQLSHQNSSFDWLAGRILGRVSGDVANLNLLLEPGTWQPTSSDNRPANAEENPAEKPLRGVKL